MRNKTIRRPEGRRWWVLSALALAAAGAFDAGCGGARDSDAPAAATASVAQPVVDCSTVPPSQAPSGIKQFITFTKDALNVFAAVSSKTPSGLGIASSAIAFVMNNIFGGGPDISGAINEIKQELDCVAQGLDWKVTALAWIDDQYGPVETAYMDLAQGFAPGSYDDVSSHQGTLESGQLPMFERTFVPSSTNGDGVWKGIVANHDPDLVDPDQVFDWRFGFPRFMSLIAKRVTIIANLNPQFISDGSRNPELEGTPGDPGYRLLLQQRLGQMIAGIRCGKVNRYDEFTNGDSRTRTTTYKYTDIACADVNTGLSAETQYTLQGTAACLIRDFWGTTFDETCMANLPDQQNLAKNLDTLRRSILSQMPVFEVQSMIDALYHFTHPTPDLTEAFGRVPAAADRGMCLDVINGDPTSGTPVWLYWCTGSVAQQWSFDRKAQTLTNTAFGKCLEVNPLIRLPLPFGGTLIIDNLWPGATPVIADCESPTPRRQQWSFDPESLVLRNGVGTVLEIQGGSVQPMNSILQGDYNGGAEQQWHADVSEGYCSNACTPGCQASCAGSGEQTGLCVGICIGGCVGDCMSVN